MPFKQNKNDFHMNHFIHIHDTMKFDLCCNEAKKIYITQILPFPTPNCFSKVS